MSCHYRKNFSSNLNLLCVVDTLIVKSRGGRKPHSNLSIGKPFCLKMEIAVRPSLVTLPTNYKYNNIVISGNREKLKCLHDVESKLKNYQ